MDTIKNLVHLVWFKETNRDRSVFDGGRYLSEKRYVDLIFKSDNGWEQHFSKFSSKDGGRAAFCKASDAYAEDCLKELINAFIEAKNECYEHYWFKSEKIRFEKEEKLWGVLLKIDEHEESVWRSRLNEGEELKVFSCSNKGVNFGSSGYSCVCKGGDFKRDEEKEHSEYYHAWELSKKHVIAGRDVIRMWKDDLIEMFHIEAVRENKKLEDEKASKVEEERRSKRKAIIDSKNEAVYGVVYLIRAQQLGRFGARGYIGQQNNLTLSRPRRHLNGNDPCTNFLINEIRMKGCSPTFDVLGQYPIKELDWREKQHATALTEAGWCLSNKFNLVSDIKQLSEDV